MFGSGGDAAVGLQPREGPLDHPASSQAAEPPAVQSFSTTRSTRRLLPPNQCTECRRGRQAPVSKPPLVLQRPLMWSFTSAYGGLQDQSFLKLGSRAKEVQGWTPRRCGR